ncbi:Uncharacterised protein [Mycobacterium tuberculosis]|uniref:Uncharacterized protein n=1 Tax=Mycobacterium tuberculosis TaxID=1773 RepID=A0A916PHM8_MYCTX|nr:Uncharacterised protein [Mycobacterium tuberculosis]
MITAAVSLVTNFDAGCVEAYQLATFRSICGRVWVVNSYSVCHVSRTIACKTKPSTRSSSR